MDEELRWEGGEVGEVPLEGLMTRGLADTDVAGGLCC